MKVIGQSVTISLISLISILPTTASASYSDFPFGSLSADVANKIINEGSVQKSGAGISLPAADAGAGYRHIKIDSLDLHAGVYDGWFRDASSFSGSLFGAGATILPVVGSNVISNSFAPDEASATSSKSHRIPAHASQFSDWHDHDSVSYTVSGGIIFSVGVGFAMTGLSGDYYARGDWTTYVEKLDSHKVSVKISNVKMNDFDLMAGNVLVSEILSKFNKSDALFSYIFDLSDARAVPAYEAMIHGSMKQAEILAAAHPELAQLDLSEKGSTKGYQKRFFLGLPFLNMSHTSGQLYNFSDTIIHSNQTRSDVDYGLYWSQSDHALISRHVSNSKAFYGISYNDKSLENATVTSEPVNGQYGKLILSYENDHSTADTVRDNLRRMIKQTGLRNELALHNDLPSGNLKYTNLSLTVVISEAATRQLISSHFGDQFDEAHAKMEVEEYFDHRRDPDQLCNSGNSRDCRAAAVNDVVTATAEMRSALKKMSDTSLDHQSVEFVRAYGNFGKAMLKNEMTFGLVAKMLGNQGMDITFQAMGSRFAKLTQKIVTDSTVVSQTSE